jgi:Ca-activated chloride channel family protein
MFDALVFTQPWLGLFALLPIFVWALRQFLWKVKAPALVFSDLRLVHFPGTLRTRTLWLPKLLASLGWLSLCVALMGPKLGNEATQVTTEGVAISMVIDVSGSMNEEDMVMDGQRVTRYDMVESIMNDFVLGNPKNDLPGRSNDMISLAVFGAYVDDLCPLTLDHDFVMDLLDNKLGAVRKDLSAYRKAEAKGDRQAVESFGKRSPIWLKTAIFDGAVMGSDLLHQSEGLGSSELDGNYKISSKIMILLSDGEDTGSTISLEEAVSVAKEFGIKIYTIAIHGQATQRDIAGLFRIGGKQAFDDTALKTLAKSSGGQFFEASNPEALASVMAEIDRLEKSKISREISTDFAPWHQPWLLTGLVFWLLSLLLQHSLYRELP